MMVMVLRMFPPDPFLVLSLSAMFPGLLCWGSAGGKIEVGEEERSPWISFLLLLKELTTDLVTETKQTYCLTVWR